LPVGRSSHERRAAPPIATVVGALLAAGLLACGAGAGFGRKANSRPRIEPRDTRLVHEDCPVTGVATRSEDIDGDGRPDRRTASVDARPRCRTLDFNFDGKVDTWVHLDDAGQLRRRENDFDSDGNVDEVSLYRAGVLVEVQRVTTRSGKLDTWHYFAAGKLARTERDSNGDDYIDQWWEYPDERARDCPLIHSDVDGDGQPDLGATVDVCRDRYSDEAPTAESGASERGVSEVPSELATPVETDSSDGAPGGSVGPAPAAPGRNP
jgi:hypothetical protein